MFGKIFIDDNNNACAFISIESVFTQESYGAGLICDDEVKGVFVDCDDANDVYVDVSAYKEWIKANSGNMISTTFVMISLIGGIICFIVMAAGAWPLGQGLAAMIR